MNMKKFEYIGVSASQLEANRKNYENYPESKPDSVYKYYDLNHFGDDGWELVTVTQSFEYGTTYYFKREKDEQ